MNQKKRKLAEEDIVVAPSLEIKDLSYYSYEKSQSEDEEIAVLKVVKLSLWELWAEVLRKMNDDDIHKYS